MDFLEHMLREVVKKTVGEFKVPFGDYVLDFEQPFARMSMYNAVKNTGNFTDAQFEPHTIDQIIAKYAIELANKQASYGEKIFALFDHLVEKTLIQPTFITDYPVEVSPLAKRDAHNPLVTARFELFIAGMECANGYNELNDPFDQAERFKQQMLAREHGDVEAQPYDAEYVLALEYGLPPTTGVGVGIDRLTMLLANTTSIKEVILFPTLKRKQEGE